MEVDVLLVVEAEVNLEVAALCLNERDWELGDLCIFARLCLCADKDGDVSVEENAIEDWDEIAIIGLYSAVCCGSRLQEPLPNNRSHSLHLRRTSHIPSEW